MSSENTEVPFLNEDLVLQISGKGLPLAICLMGPTAAGKTDLALALTENLPCDIISVDSALIYKGMDIGTAKPDKVFLKKHRIDLLILLSLLKVILWHNFMPMPLEKCRKLQQEAGFPF